MPEVTGVPDSGDAGLGGANARLRELLAERDAHIAQLLAQAAQLDELRSTLHKPRLAELMAVIVPEPLT